MFLPVINKIKQLSFKHQNNKMGYYLLNNFRRIFPLFIFRARLKGKLNKSKLFDPEYVQKRVDYYNRLETQCPLLPTAIKLSELKLGKKLKVYYFDTFEFTRYFDQNLRANFLFGDIIHVADVPSLVKSRPIHVDNTNSIVLNMEKIRHFRFLNDTKQFVNKKNMLIFRGQIFQPHRYRFMEMYYNHPMCNIGQINKNSNQKFLVNRMTVDEHLDYKFILSLEGNDVASNLKWIMSSNSLAVMPTPKYETWFMEGTLIPNYHSEHTDEALKIIENAHTYIDQFKNKEREDFISFQVLKKYFEKTGQTVSV
jgi:Glycosyl transferase family 90